MSKEKHLQPNIFIHYLPNQHKTKSTLEAKENAMLLSGWQIKQETVVRWENSSRKLISKENDRRNVNK